MSFCRITLVFVRGLIVSRAKLSLELLALRQQPGVLRRTVGRLQIQNRDRRFWIVVSRIWKDWRQALIFVKPETVIKWHRQRFRRYWRWKSRSSQAGRPKLDKEIRNLIRRISDENPLWGVPRIQSELHLLRYKIAESTVAKYRIRNPKPQCRMEYLRSTGVESRPRREETGFTSRFKRAFLFELRRPYFLRGSSAGLT
jgi:putative transposase